MRRATENQRNTRTLREYFTSRNKVKDLTLQQCSPRRFTSLLQETPMQPSQVPNRLSHPPPRRLLPLQSPELCHRDRLGQPRQRPHPLGPIHSSRLVPSSPTNIVSPANRHHLTPKDRLGPLQHFSHHPGSFNSSRLVAVSPTKSGATVNKPQSSTPSISHHASPQFKKDLINHSPPSHIRRDQVTKSKVALCNSGSKNVTAQRQESNKAQSSDVRSPIRTVPLQRSPMAPSLNARAAQEVSLPLSDSEEQATGTLSSDRCSGSTLPIMQSPVAPSQDQQHKRTPSNEKSISGVDFNYSSQKRRRDFEDCGYSAKKPCLQDTSSGKAQTPKPPVGNSLSTSLASQPSPRHSSVLELSTNATNSHLCTEAACGPSTCLELSSTFKPTQSSCTSLSPKPCIERRPSMGVKQAYIYSAHTAKVIELRSPFKLGEGGLKKRREEIDKRDKLCSLSSSEVPQKDTGSSPHSHLGSHHSGHTQRSTSVLPVKTLSRGDQGEESRKSDSSTPKPTLKSNSCFRTAERSKTSRPRRPVAIPDDIDELFTPDLMTYVVSPGHKTAKPKLDGATIGSPTSEKRSSSSTGTSSSTPVTGSSYRKSPNFTVTGSSPALDTNVSSLSSAPHPQISMPIVALERVKLENFRCFSPKENSKSELKNSPISSSGRQLKHEGARSDGKRTSTVETDTTPSERSSTSHSSLSPLLKRQARSGGRKQVNEEDPVDVELDLGLSFALDLDLTQSSNSSEEEQLLSLQEMMERVTKPTDTPEKGAFSEPSTPGHHSCQSKIQPLPSTRKSGMYKNNLDQMLKEINTNKRAKEMETQLLSACKEDLLRIAEYEEAEENREEGISTEHQEFLQRYSLMSNAIKEVPPGEEVFNLEKFGQIFNHDTLQLRECMVNPQGTIQKTLLWSSPAQLRLHVNIGLFQEAYNCRSPCPTRVSRFLFKMMSVHSERMVSEKILQALCDIACTAAYQIVKNRDQQFKVWVPSLADVALVLINMGVAFVTLFPFENLQPPFTEGDLLEDIYIKSESPSSKREQSFLPEHNCNNVFKYLSCCMGLCPRAYSDDELLLLLTVVGRVGLDTRLILQSSIELYPLQYKLINNFREWDTMLPRMCLALTDLTDDHHNMCLLVQLLPDNTRGKQLRRHLSLSMISKLLDGNCTYRPTQREIQLSELRPYLPRMQPSSLLRGIQSQKDKEQDMATLDQQSYYLCYSLLTLANEASNFQFFPVHQKEHLLFLCSELETHVKCDIRESEKCLYRSKVKDLVARIYTKWQMLLHRTRPLHGKLYDYWQPLFVDTLTSSQEEQEMNSDDGAGSEREEEEEEDEEEEEETSTTEENEVVMTVKEEGDDTLEGPNKTEDNTKPETLTGGNAMHDTDETGDATEFAHGKLNQETPEMESKGMDGQLEAENIEHTEVEQIWLRRENLLPVAKDQLAI